MNQSASVGPTQVEGARGKNKHPREHRTASITLLLNSLRAGGRDERGAAADPINTYKSWFHGGGIGVVRREKHKVEAPDGTGRDGDSAALSLSLLLPSSLLPSLRPSARREAELSVAAGPHTVPPGLSSRL